MRTTDKRLARTSSFPYDHPAEPLELRMWIGGVLLVSLTGGLVGALLIALVWWLW